MPIDASSDPYDLPGFDPAAAKLGDLPGSEDDDDIDLDDAGFGAAGRAATVLDDDLDDVGGGGKFGAAEAGTDEAGADDDVAVGKIDPGLDLDGAGAGADDEGLDLDDDKFADTDDDLDLDDVGTGAKLDPAAAVDDADDDVDDLVSKSGLTDLDDGDFGADDDVDSDLGGRFGAGVGLDDDVDDDFGKGDLDDDVDDPDDVDDGIFDFG